MVITLSLPGLQQLFLSLCTGENFDKKREIIKNEKCESEVICGGFQSPEVEKWKKKGKNRQIYVFGSSK